MYTQTHIHVYCQEIFTSACKRPVQFCILFLMNVFSVFFQNKRPSLHRVSTFWIKEMRKKLGKIAWVKNKWRFGRWHHIESDWNAHRPINLPLHFRHHSLLPAEQQTWVICHWLSLRVFVCVSLRLQQDPSPWPPRQTQARLTLAFPSTINSEFFCLSLPQSLHLSTLSPTVWVVYVHSCVCVYVCGLPWLGERARVRSSEGDTLCLVPR